MSEPVKVETEKLEQPQVKVQESQPKAEKSTKAEKNQKSTEQKKTTQKKKILQKIMDKLRGKK